MGNEINVNAQSGSSIGITGNQNAPTPQQPKKPSLFQQIDTNKDGKIAYQELLQAGYSKEKAAIFWQEIFFAERDVEKWANIDRNMDGLEDSSEQRRWMTHNVNPQHLEGDYTYSEYNDNFGLTPEPISKNRTLTAWLKDWLEDENPMCGHISRAKTEGVELTPEEIQLLQDASKIQANRWLFKDPNFLYQRLNSDAYTRIITNEDTVSCCGGNIVPPPMTDRNSCSIVFSAMDRENATNTADEVRNRLAWGAFKTAESEEAVAKMSPEEYATYKAAWDKLRGMKASDFRTLLNDEEGKKAFEANSNMTVQQIVDYIDIVESVTGKPFDSEDWSINYEQFGEIQAKVNGTHGDDTILEGKTRADIPPEKQAWLKYLEENGMLLDQFKE